MVAPAWINPERALNRLCSRAIVEAALLIKATSFLIDGEVVIVA